MATKKKTKKPVSFVVTAENTFIPNPVLGQNAERGDTEGYIMATPLATTALVDAKTDGHINCLQIVQGKVFEKFIKQFNAQKKRFPNYGFMLHLSPQLSFFVTKDQFEFVEMEKKPTKKRALKKVAKGKKK